MEPPPRSAEALFYLVCPPALIRIISIRKENVSFIPKSLSKLNEKGKLQEQFPITIIAEK